MDLRYKLPGPNYLPAFFLGKKGSLFGNDSRLDDIPPDTVGVVHAIPVIPQDRTSYTPSNDTEIHAMKFQRLETTLEEYREIWRELGHE